jgi:hypothetical protein
VKKYTLLLFLFSFLSCKKKEAKTPPTTNGTYFSIVQFARDQFTSFWGQPYSFRKVVTLNGKTDSTFASVNNMDWNAVLKPFFSSDISDKKYLDQYNFSMFQDDATETRNFYYEAKNQKLFTRKLHIMADMFTDKITSIYIETEKNGKVQKLFYAPLKLIQIQEYESSFLGENKDLKVEYYFM